METHAGSTSHEVEDSSMRTYNGPTSHWVEDSSMRTHTGSIPHWEREVDRTEQQTLSVHNPFQEKLDNKYFPYPRQGLHAKSLQHI